jgi:hypothetical protein
MDYLELEDEDGGPDDNQTPGSPSTAADGKAEHDAQEYQTKEHVLGRIRRCGIQPARFLDAVDAFFKRPWWYVFWLHLITSYLPLVNHYCPCPGLACGQFRSLLWRNETPYGAAGAAPSRRRGSAVS